MQSSFTAILPAGGDAAPDMPLSFVDLQNLMDLKVECTIELRQSLGNILMYGRLADTEFLRGGADRRLILYDVLGQMFGPLLHVPLQMQHSPPGVASSYAGEKENMKDRFIRW